MKITIMSLKTMVFGISICILLLTLIQGCTASAPTATKQPAQSGLQSGGILKIGIQSFPPNFGYSAALTYKAAEEMVSRPAIEHLARFDTSGVEQPWLAESWQADANTKTFTVKLKKGIKFHDGTDFNAEAVKWNWQQWRNAKKAEVALISSIDVIDDYTVRANLSLWDNDIVYSLAVFAGGIMSPAVYQKNGEEWCLRNPVGTGPFKIDSSAVDVNIIYKKFDGYWQKGKPYLDGIEFKTISNTATMRAAFEAGEVDMVLGLGIPEVVALKNNPKYRVIVLENGMSVPVWELFPDGSNKDSPFSNLKVRQAVGHAINSKAIVDSIFFGYATVTNQFVAPTSFAYNPNLKGQPYNPEKAKQLLSEAGYPAGFKTTLTVPNQSVFPDAGAAMQAMLKAVGIDTKLDIISSAARSVMSQKGWTNSILLTTPRSYPGSLNMVSIFHTSKSAWAVSSYHHEVVDKILEQAITADLKSKKELMWKLWAAMYDEYCIATPILIEQFRGIHYPYVNNHGFYITEGSESTPEDTWIKK